MKMEKITIARATIGADQDLILVPRGINPATGVASLSEANSVPAVETRVTLSVAAPSRQSGAYTVRLKVQAPSVCKDKEVCDPKVQRTALADVTFKVSRFSTAAERKAIRGTIIGLLSDPLLIDAVDNLNPAY